MPSRIQDPVPKKTGTGRDAEGRPAQATYSNAVPKPPIDQIGVPPLQTPASRPTFQPGQANSKVGEGINVNVGQVDTSDPNSGGQLAHPGNVEPAGGGHESTGSQRIEIGSPNSDPNQSDSGGDNSIGGDHSDPSHIDSNHDPQDANPPIDWSNLSPDQMSQLHNALDGHQPASPNQPEHSSGSGEVINDPSGSVDDHESAPIANNQQGGNAVGPSPGSNSGAEQAGSPSHFDGLDVAPSIMESIKDALSGSSNNHQARPAGKNSDSFGDSVGGMDQLSNEEGNPNARPPYNTDNSGPTASTFDTKHWSPSQVSGIAEVLLPSGSPNEISAVAKALAPTEPNPSPSQESAIHDALAASGSNLLPDQISSIRDTLASSGSSSSTDLIAKINDALAPSGSRLSPEEASKIQDTFAHDEPRLSPEQVSNIENALASSGPNRSPGQLSNIVNGLAPSGTNLSPDQIASIENILATSGPKLSLEQLSGINSALSTLSKPQLSPDQISKLESTLASSGPNPSPEQLSNMVNALAPRGTSLSPNQIASITNILAIAGPKLSPSQISALNSALSPPTQTSLSPSSSGDVSPSHVPDLEDDPTSDGSATSAESAAASTTLDSGDERGGSATTAAERPLGTHTRKSGSIRHIETRFGLSILFTFLVLVVGCTF